MQDTVYVRREGASKASQALLSVLLENVTLMLLRQNLPVSAVWG
jgi:hypothetical protein